MRYLLYSFKPAPLIEEGQLLSGLFHWQYAMGGAMGCPELDTLSENYDVVHVNFTSGSLGLIGDIAEAIRGSSTKLVVNVDYAVEMWDQTIPFPSLWLRELDKADALFHVEQRGADLLSMALSRSVECIPHPVNTNGLMALAKPLEIRANTLSCILHRYTMNFTESWLIAKAFQKELKASTGRGVDLTAVVCAQELSEEVRNRLPGMYDLVESFQAYPAFLQTLANSWAVYDTNPWSTFGRVVTECAILCVPCIGNENTQAMREMFPELAFAQGDVRGRKDMLHTLSTEPQFYKQVTEYAFNYILENCAYEPSKEAFLALLGVEKEKINAGQLEVAG